MAITSEIVRAAARTAGIGTQDFTFAGFGAVKAAVFIATYATADGVAIANSGFSYGFTDGTTEICIHGNDEDGQATSDAFTEIFPSSVINFSTAGTGTSLATASFDSFITDGVRVDWSIVDVGFLVTVILLGGDDLQTFVGSQPLGNIVDTAHVVANVGFETHLALTLYGDTLNNPGKLAGGNNRYGMGVVHNNEAGGITQRAYSNAQQTGVNPSRAASFMSATYGAVYADQDSGVLDWGAEFSAFGGAGFTITERNSGANNSEVYYLCLRGGDPSDFSVGTHTIPGAIGDVVDIGPDFEPQLVMLGMTQNSAVDSGSASGDASGTNGIGAFTPTDEFSNSVQSEDAVSPTNTQSLSDNTAVLLPDDDGTVGITGSFVSMDAVGFTLNYSTVKAGNRVFWYAAIKSFPAAGGDTFNEHPWTVPVLWYLPYWKHR